MFMATPGTGWARTFGPFLAVFLVKEIVSLSPNIIFACLLKELQKEEKRNIIIVNTPCCRCCRCCCCYCCCCCCCCCSERERERELCLSPQNNITKKTSSWYSTWTPVKSKLSHIYKFTGIPCVFAVEHKTQNTYILINKSNKRPQTTNNWVLLLVCVCNTHRHTHTHACMHACTNTHTHTHTHTHMHACTHAQTHTHTHTHTHICMHKHSHTHTHTNKHTHTHALDDNIWDTDNNMST